MIGVAGVIFSQRLAPGILHTWLTAGKLPCNLGEPLIDKICLLLAAHPRVEIDNCHNLAITVLGSEFPCYLYDGTVNLHAKEVFGFSCYAHRCFERDRSADIRNGGGTHESVAIPGTSIIP